MMVEWRLFANLAEATGSRSVEVDVATGPDAEATVGDALATLVDAHPDLEPLVLADGELRDHINLLRNGSPTDPGDPVEADDELAIFPPVTGG
jgi:molybdopterin synthase sulfur carrier subunit